MAYNALDSMKRINEELLGVQIAGVPKLGEDIFDDGPKSDIPASACRFIRECEDLGFNPGSDEIASYRELLERLNDQKDFSTDNKFTGKSAGRGQIPENVEKDLDRLSFENAIRRFCKTGSGDDAFDVYFCYLSIFFGDYRNTRDIIEMLCEFENNAGSLLMKHRDHYSHSVYVFLIGLAIYENNRLYRNSYSEYYNRKMKSEGREETLNEIGARRHFLKFWGLTSLFHDIGYPFELPFEQIKSYFANSVYKRTARSIKDSFIQTMPYVAYQNMNDFLSNLNINSRTITQTDLNEKIDQWTNNERVCDLSDVFSLQLSKMLTGSEKYYDPKNDKNPFTAYCKSRGIRLLEDKAPDNYQQLYRRYLQDVLGNKPSHPEAFNGYMDHAYFSAVLMLHKMNEMKELQINTDYTDALCAILLHNSIFKRAIVTNGNRDHAFSVDESPLAYLLMLCDELQCWDRASYGLNNRNAIYAMDCHFSFDESDDSVEVRYIFDEYFKKNRRLEFYDWIKEKAAEKNSSLKEYYKSFRALDENDYKNLYDSEIYRDSGETVYHYFLNILDNPSVDLPEKMNDYLQMSTTDKESPSKFFSDLEEIVKLDGTEGVLVRIPPVDSKISTEKHKEKNTYLSRSSYMHLYDFAVALNYQYNCRNKEKVFIGASPDMMEESFADISLEYQLSNINQAKSFAGYLDEIGAYYTDRPVGYPPLDHFEDDELRRLGIMEHDRWWEEKKSMGWTADKWIREKEGGHGEITSRLGLKDRVWLRECIHIHCDMRKFSELDQKDIRKDTDPMNDMVRLLEEYDGLRIYRTQKNKKNG